MISTGKTTDKAGRFHQYGVVLTGIGSCFFLAGVVDLFIWTVFDARLAFMAAGWFLVIGWMLEQWAVRKLRYNWRFPFWMRMLMASVPLGIYLFCLEVASYVLHDKVAEAAYRGDMDTVQRLATFDPVLSGSPWEWHYTPLYGAVQSGNRQIVEYFLRMNVDPNRPSDHGETPLKLARSSKRNDLEAMLIAAGASK
jgi:hypothetical protein